jgi:uncharacterized protein HemX
MTTQHQPNDPYAPPPRHKDSSGAVVRVAILAGLLGLAAAGYGIYAGQAQEASNAEMGVEEQQFAESDTGVAASDSEFALPAEPEETAPASGPQPAPEPAPASEAQDLPPPSTTVDPQP